jgi:ADP-ribose pyrophosphatase
MKKTFEIIDKKNLLDDFLEVNAYQLTHDMFSGEKTPVIRRLCLEKQNAVSVLLFDPVHNNVVMVEQFRIGAKNLDDSWLLENPAGYFETDESPQQVAVREVMEETGCEVSNLIEICKFLVSPGISNEMIMLYCGKVDSSNAEGIHGVDDEHEDIRVEVLSLEQAKKELYTGRINSTSTIISMQWLLLNIDDIKKQWS